MQTKGLLLLQGVIALILLPAVVQTESHWESYAGWALAYQWTCYPYSYTYCNNWYNYGYYLGYHTCGCGLFRNYASVCYTAVSYNCFTNCIGWVPVTLWRCQYGWKGGNCDIPICDNPVCRSDQICSRPNYCDCIRSGSTGECTLGACDDGPNENCYPGFCDKSPYPWRCVCPPGFSGPNCQTISSTPDINSCSVQIFGTPSGGKEQEVVRASECAAQGLNPLPIWIGSAAANSLTRILVTWEADYSNQLTLPDRGKAPYINNAPVPIGIIESNFTVSFPSSTNVPARSEFCVNIDPSQTIPQKIQKCSVVMNWPDIGASSQIQTNFTFTVSIEAQVGGAKKGDPTQSGGRFYTAQVFSRDSRMNTTIRTAKFAFDLEPPYHCLSTSTSSDCPVFPIFLNQTMTSNPVIEPTFNAWRDDGSGISRFHAEVFFMQPDQQGLLVQVGDPLVSADVNITLNNFRYTCRTPGVYSIVLTVYDKANNSAKARKIFNYDDHDSSVQETASPVYLDKANPTTDYKYITRLDKLQNPDDPYQFNLIWTGHFDTTYRKEWLGAVRPWQIQNGAIDDSYGPRYGLRSIDAVTNTTGVLGYEIAYVVDGNGTGGIGLSAPNNFAAITNPKSTSYPITVGSKLKDGDTIVVWLKVYDLYGQQTTVMSRTYVDTSRFNINVTNAGFRKHYPDQYNSSVAITVSSKYGGIKNITYTIKDNTRKVDVYTGTMLPKVLERPPAFNRRRKRDSVEIPCAPNDRTCYCIPSGPCFNTTQLINIDNCWIDRGVAGDQVIVEYTIYTLSAWTLTGTVDAGVLAAEDIACREVQTLSRDAKIGIGIAVAIIGILLILLIILLILMCIRWRVYHKHPVPFSIRTTIHNTFGRNRAPSAVHIMSENELYASSDLSLPKKSNEQPMVWAKKLWDVKSEDHGVDSSKVFSGKDLHMEDIVADGRFAVIRRGNLSVGNEKTPVAVKVLRSGYDKIDPEVMRSKIAFMASKVKPHPNVIRFIGSVAEENSQASPVMLLELCDKPLKDWLSEISIVDNDVFEEMLSFGLQIARGVRHLHDHGIIHRRLAVRNILLKHSLSGYEVKLIGFGPAKDDYESSDQSTMSVSMVPLKWMAPETLESLNSAKPVYDKETDAWSYGVTLWEIFSKGAAPYANHKSLDMKAVLKRGERLTCPESCPPELFNQVLYPCWNSNPKKRPNFSTICTVLEKFRNDTGAEYYAAQDRPGNPADPPPGYYAAGSMLRDNPRAMNNPQGPYQEARSG